MALRYDTVTFLSDYGRADEFVGVVHSVIRSIAPAVTVIDLTHDIAAFDVRGGGLALARSVHYLCPGVVLAVVDPGVGSARRAIAVEVGDGASVLVGPDNGLLAPAVAFCGGATRAVELTSVDHRLPAPGATFAGRDIFAPAAAHLCLGVPLEQLGTLVEPSSLFPGMLPVAHRQGDELVAEVLWVDHYGNAQLNVDPDEVTEFGGRVALRIGDVLRTATRVESYREIGVGEIGLVVDSYGLLAVAGDQHAAAGDLGLHAGTLVCLSEAQDEPELDGTTTPVTLSARPPQDDDRGGTP